MRPGVLLLQANRTFGRRKDKLLYRCLLADHTSVLVPYRLKSAGFNKHRSSKFVLVEETAEVIQDRPVALLSNVIGDVDDLPSFFEYQLHVKGLWHQKKSPMYVAIQPRRKDADALLEQVRDLCQHDRTDRTVFSVDPPGCKDIDDAYGLTGDMLSIYISNVGLWFHVLGLLSSPELVEQPATIYLPNGNRDMLPELLSCGWCSLLEEQPRPALVCDIDLSSGETTFTTAMIRVTKNWDYDGFEHTAHYTKVMQVVQQLNEREGLTAPVKDSHDLVAWMMIRMSHSAARKMERGMFRGVQSGSSSGGVVPKEIRSFMQGWSSTGGRYVLEPERHELLGLDRYVHITSPIRRLPDLVNGLLLQSRLQLLPSTTTFTDYWLDRIEQINAESKAIGRIQIQCNLLHQLSDESANNAELVGYIVDKFDGEDRYVVYLPQTKLVATYRTSKNLTRLSKHRFKIRLFKHEETFKKKVRLVLIEEENGGANSQSVSSDL